jgi:hypothetical protein
VDPLAVFSSVQIGVLRLDRKNLSGRNERPGILSAMSNVRLVAGDATPDGVADALVERFEFIVGGIAGVKRGRAPIVDVVSTGTATGGFLMNERKRCRHRSSGISELSKSTSRNCRKPW